MSDIKTSTICLCCSEPFSAVYPSFAICPSTHTLTNCHSPLTFPMPCYVVRYPPLRCRRCSLTYLYRQNPLASRSNELYASFLCDRASGKASRPSRPTYELDISTSDGYTLSSSGEISSSEECYLPPSTYLEKDTSRVRSSSIKRTRPPPPRKRVSSINKDVYVSTPNVRCPHFGIHPILV